MKSTLQAEEVSHKNTHKYNRGRVKISILFIKHFPLGPEAGESGG